MAVTRLWPVTNQLSYVIDYATDSEKTEKYSSAEFQGLKDVLAYAKDEEKTEREFFCDGINCNVAIARDQFVTVKEQFAKTGGIQAYHGYLSFKEENITPELAQKIGMEFAQKVWGGRFQVVVTTHLNTKHLHCHFVVNSISFADGKRCRDTSWFKFYRIADEICKSYGLETIEDPQRHPPPKNIGMMEKKGKPTTYSNMRDAMDYAIEHSRSPVDLKYNLQLLGYECDFSPHRTYWTIRKKDAKRNMRLYRLGEDYTNECIIERLRENQNKVFMEPFQKPTIMFADYRHKKVGGLYGLYFHYCYLLGKGKNRKSYRLHYLLRDDLLKLDQLTEQVRFLGDHNITTSEELFSFRDSVEEKIKTLSSKRTELRNEIRRVGVSEERIKEAKEEITEISTALKKLRRERKHCVSIAERSGVMESNLNAALAEEEKQHGKELMNYESQR